MFLACCIPNIPIAQFDATSKGRQVQVCEYFMVPSPYTVYRQRKNFRIKYGIPGNQYTDALVSNYCFSCAIVQNVRELAKEKKEDPVWMQMPDFDSNPPGFDPH